jgi:hypothetical protein
VARGGTTLAPPAAAPLQWIDAKDLAEFTVRLCEARTPGVFNAVGTQTDGLGGRATFGELLEACDGLAEEPQPGAGAGNRSASTPQVVHATAEYLGAEGVTPMAGPRPHLSRSIYGPYSRPTALCYI